MHVDHFQSEKIIAAGPSAKVYRGVETMTGRKVLIKALLHDHETAHPLDRERLQLLAPSLMQMRHPQIAGLITLLPTEDEFAIVSEHMPGINARTFAAERKPAPADVRALAVQLMHALMMGEHLRQPHGDPKPSNIIIADHPGGGLFLQLQDWGISMARHAHPPETLWFRAPELYSGFPPTSQSDLFTAAGSLFCIATNTAPAQGTTMEEVMADWQAFNASHVLSHLRPDLDPPLRDWLAWLLNLSPQMRPHSVAQALDVLMLSMHTGFIYMPQQAPAMAPGTQTTQLASAAHPNAPKPKPVVSKAAAAAAAAAAAEGAVPAVAPKKKGRSRVMIAVALNLATLAVIGFYLWPVIRPSIPGLEVTATASSKPETSAAAPAALPAVMADDAKAAPAASVPPTPSPGAQAAAPAVTEATAPAR
jgi:serine/threonine protein kinase